MRLIAMGDACLTDGFDLLGFETYPNTSPEQAEQILCGLITSKERALVFMEQGLIAQAGKCYQRLRNESGHVIIIGLPPLHAPEDYHPEVEDLVRRVLGPGALEESSA
jgi:vacuolar-type H+-ATPase subunit F/Vma7